MSRKCRAVDEVSLKKAVEVIRTTTDAHDLRGAQAFLLPYALGLDLEQVSLIIGKSYATTERLRREFPFTVSNGTSSRRDWGGRRRQNMSFDEEQTLLAPFLQKAKEGGVLIVTPIKIAYEEKTGRKVAESTIYRMLARHNWRKLAPDTGHPKGDPALQEEYKKNSPKW
jgi:Winged helix-turn helix